MTQVTIVRMMWKPSLMLAVTMTEKVQTTTLTAVVSEELPLPLLVSRGQNHAPTRI
jgi:hypothetical protein